MASRIASKLGGGLALVALVGVVGWIGLSSDQGTSPERWFMPGELGHEPGAAPAALSEHAFLTRAMGSLGGEAGKVWAANNRLTSRLNFSHNLSRVFPPSLYDQHPEFFPVEAGQRLRPPEGSGWWQPDLGRQDVAAYAASAANDYFETNPDAVSFALGVNDGLVFGESVETKALTMPVRWFRGRPDYSNLVFTFMNRVAADLALTHPDKYVGALAYYWAEQVPDFAVDRHVIPFLTADRSQGYDPQFLAEDRDLQKRWASALRAGREKEEGRMRNEDGGRTADDGGLADRGAVELLTQSRKGAERDVASQASVSRRPTGGKSEIGDGRLEIERDRSDRAKNPNSKLQTSNSESPRLRLGLYDYLYGGGFLIPRQHPHLLAEHLRTTRRLGFTDYYAEVYANWGLDGPQPWLVAQLLQDPEQSVEALLDEYYHRYFKEAANPMRRFFERCEEQWLNQPGEAYWLKFYRNETQAILFPPAVCRELRGILNEAAASATSGQVRARILQVSDTFGVTERFVAMQTWRDHLNREVLSEDGSLSRVSGFLRAFLRARESFVSDTQSLQASQPLLMAPFKKEDYLRHDPTVNALLWLQSREKDPRAELPSVLRKENGLVELWAPLREPGQEIIRNGTLQGEVKPPRMIAGLPFEVALPQEWKSKVEPAEHYRDTLRGTTDRVLRVEGSVVTSVYQWSWVNSAGFDLAGVKVRGKLSPSARMMLTISWLDAEQRHLEISRMLLPTGEWPEWKELWQGGFAPKGTMWVGIGIALTNQGKGDWIEVKDFTLEAKSAEMVRP